MKLTSESFQCGAAIPSNLAFGKHHPEKNVELCENRNPQLSWTDVPEGTKSFAVICHDSDVPSSGDDVNKAGRTVPMDLKRVDFYHWVLVDLPSSKTSIAEGEYSSAITAKGKPGPDQDDGSRTGLNNYTQWFDGDADMGGEYFGYDGPCPPWNDELLHHYHFTVYALGIEKCPVEGKFTGPDVLAAMAEHTLGKASITGTYHIYPGAKTKD